jgi:hypothetical protein
MTRLHEWRAGFSRIPNRKGFSMIKGICIFWLCMMPALAFGKGLSTEKDARALADEVMAEVGAGDMIKGIEHLRPYNVHAENEFDASLAQIKSQLPDLRQRFGKTIG